MDIQHDEQPVPVKSRPRSPLVQALLALEVKGSLVVSDVQQNRLSSTLWHTAKTYGRKFTHRKLDDGKFRVWRMK